jgi:hypothetical protein
MNGCCQFTATFYIIYFLQLQINREQITTTIIIIIIVVVVVVVVVVAPTLVASGRVLRELRQCGAVCDFVHCTLANRQLCLRARLFVASVVRAFTESRSSLSV